jgi:hypothetical protein
VQRHRHDGVRVEVLDRRPNKPSVIEVLAGGAIPMDVMPYLAPSMVMVRARPTRPIVAAATEDRLELLLQRIEEPHDGRDKERATSATNRTAQPGRAAPHKS